MEYTIYIHNYSNEKCCNDHTARDFGLIFRVFSSIWRRLGLRAFLKRSSYSNENKMRFALHNRRIVILMAIRPTTLLNKFTDSNFFL